MVTTNQKEQKAGEKSDQKEVPWDEAKALKPPKKAEPKKDPPEAARGNSAAQSTSSVQERLQRAVEEGVKAETNMKRSPDLVPLGQNFDVTRKQLHTLLLSAKKHHESLQQLDQTRMEMVKQMAAVAETSPVAEQVIGDPEQERSKAVVPVYKAASVQAVRDQKRFHHEVIDYIAEWERIVTTRVDAELKEAKKLRETFNHYQTKVDGLRKKVNDLEAKEKKPSPAQTEKLERNEKKLDDASKEYEAYAGRLCILLEEVTACAWKDLIPLLQALMKWEAGRAAHEAEVFAELKKETAVRLSEAAEKHKKWRPKSVREQQPGSPRSVVNKK
jgi:hypothetical protein